MRTLLALLGAFLATSAWALPVAWEPFAYPTTPTNLVGQVNPNGVGFTWWQAGPTTGGTNVPSIYPGNLSYPGLAPSTGNAV
ncbi:MAG TPA: hypothetical protein VMU04_14585, partial [Candidatus Acidoferrum sp.]|nr:hypothetical protein [Candidatus Acidoferrum sp.]